tara:strand:- start:146 stop:802 length:657 start_codon:yes stop_codon:yes gene_type:complete
MKAIVIGGSKGIGKAISDELNTIDINVISTNSKDLDTSDLNSVNSFINDNPKTDILVLNTGGPPPTDFNDIDLKTWQENFNKLFLSFALILNKIEINKGGYVFLVSSFAVKEPDPELILSSSLRVGFVSLMKMLSKLNLKKAVRYINIAPGPIKTERLVGLLKNSGESIEEFSENFPGNQIPEPEEIGMFVRFVVENQIKSFNGSTIYFDSGLLNNYI